MHPQLFISWLCFFRLRGVFSLCHAAICCLHPSVSPAVGLAKYLIYDFVDIFGSILAKNVRVPFVGALRRLAIVEIVATTGDRMVFYSYNNFIRHNIEIIKYNKKEKKNVKKYIVRKQ